MASVDDLLRKSKDRINKIETDETEKVQQARVKISRQGPKRPWQDQLPEYKQDPSPTPLPHMNENPNGDNLSLQTGTNGDKQDFKREQIPFQTGTNGDKPSKEALQTGTNTLSDGDKREQIPSKSASIHNVDSFIETPSQHNTYKKSIPTQDQLHSNGNKREQISLVPVSEDICSRLKEPLSPFDHTFKREQTGTVPVSEDACSHLQTETSNGNKREQKTYQTVTANGDKRGQISLLQRPLAGLPTADQQLAILVYIASEQKRSGLNHTPRLKRSDIALALGISTDSVKTQVERLCRTNHLERYNSKKGRGETGTVYYVAAETMRLLDIKSKWEQQTGTNGDKKEFKREQQMGTNGDKIGFSSDVSSSSINTTTNKETSDILQNACELAGLTDYGFGGNDAMAIFRKGVFQDVQTLVESLAHIGWYLHTDEAKTIRHHKAWLAKTLGAGYYRAPPGYRSPEELQEEAYLKDMEVRAERIQEARKKRVKLEYDIWAGSLTPVEIQKLLGKTPFADRPESIGAQALLRNHYATQQGIPLELLQD